MGVEPTDQDAWLGDAEFFFQVGVQDSRHPLQTLRRDRIGNLAQRQVGGDQRHAQTTGGEHHDHLRGMGQVGEEFRVPGKSDTGFIDHAFVHRGGDHSGKMPIQAALARSGQGFQDESGVGLVQLPGDDLGVERCIPDIQAVGGSGNIRPVVRRDGQHIDSHTQLRGPLKEQVAAGNGNQGVRLGLRGEQQAQVGTYAGWFAGCQRETLGFHCAAWSAPGSLISTYASSRI
ncbi:hypothetical protein D9M73_145070 [compost metagenome]